MIYLFFRCSLKLVYCLLRYNHPTSQDNKNKIDTDINDKVDNILRYGIFLIWLWVQGTRYRVKGERYRVQGKRYRVCGSLRPERVGRIQAASAAKYSPSCRGVRHSELRGGLPPPTLHYACFCFARRPSIAIQTPE